MICFSDKGGVQVANRVRGISVELSADTTKLQTALKGVNTQIRSTQS